MPPDSHPDEEPVVLVTFAPAAPLDAALAVRATVLPVCDPGEALPRLLAVELPGRPGLVAAAFRSLPGCLSAHVRRARPAPPASDPSWTRLRVRCPAAGPVDYWLAPPPLVVPVVPVLVLQVTPGTSRAAVLDAAHLTTALPDGAGRWVLVDPTIEAAQAVRSASWSRNVHSAHAVAVLTDEPDLAPVRDVLSRAARQTITVADPDFGPVTYALFDTEADAQAALAAFE